MLSLAMLSLACGGEGDDREPDEQLAEAIGEPGESGEQAGAAESAEVPTAETEIAEAEVVQGEGVEVEDGAGEDGANESGVNETEVEVVNAAGESAAEDLAETTRQVEAALAEAAAAESGESNACERAYVGVATVLERMRETHPDQTRPLPPHDDFMAVCAELPEGMPDCLSPTFAVAHSALCLERSEALSDEERSTLEALLGGS